MILRRITEAFRRQDWFTVAIETLIVVLGVFLGLQVNNWNEARATEARKAEIVAALVTDLKDATYVMEQAAIPAIDAGLADWEAAFQRGETPAPYYFRMDGSDIPPNTWSVLQQMDIIGLFDPVTIFDLNMYYSEMDGVGRKYIRYVTFVEDDILPYEPGNPGYFYTDDGAALKPQFRASMDRLREWRGEMSRLGRWANCLADRLDAGTHPEMSCLRADPSISAESLLALPQPEPPHDP